MECRAVGAARSGRRSTLHTVLGDTRRKQLCANDRIGVQMTASGFFGGTVVLKETLATQVTIRMTDADMARLTALVERLPVASRNAIAREALRIGMAALEEDPERLVKKPRS